MINPVILSYFTSVMSAERPLSQLEMKAKMRDLKRRRQSYRGKSTHTANKNYTEVLCLLLLNCAAATVIRFHSLIWKYQKFSFTPTVQS